MNKKMALSVLSELLSLLTAKFNSHSWEGNYDQKRQYLVLVDNVSWLWDTIPSFVEEDMWGASTVAIHPGTKAQEALVLENRELKSQLSEIRKYAGQLQVELLTKEYENYVYYCDEDEWGPLIEGEEPASHKASRRRKFNKRKKEILDKWN